MKIARIITVLSFIICYKFMFCPLSAIDIKGRTIDMNTKKPVEYASLTLLSSDSIYVSGCQTDSLGLFTLSGKLLSQDYLIRTSYLGYKDTYVKVSNLSKNINLGDIELLDDSKQLGEITVLGSRIINHVDRQVILPDSMQMKVSVNAFDLLANMSIPRLNIDPVNRTIKIGSEEVQLRINGIKASVEEVAALRSQDILRVEYFDDPGVRFGNENVGAVVNLIVDRQKNYGGYLSVDGQNSPYVGFGNDNLTFKLNNKASEFGINYNVNYRSYDKRWLEQSETLDFPDNPIYREQKGLERPMEYQYHRMNFSYNLTKVDRYVFNVIFKNQIYTHNMTSASDNFYSDRANPTFSESKKKTAEYVPALDVYYRQEMKNKQSIAVNIVGTYMDSDNKSHYLETKQAVTLSDIYNKVDGNKYSIIGEVVYEKQFNDIVFSAGGKHTQGYANNTYLGNTNTKTDMKNSDSYLFAQAKGKLMGKIGYTLGLGSSRIWFKEGDNQATFHTFLPSMQLSYSTNDNWTFKYVFSIWNRTPSLGQLSNVEQEIDSYQISRGNPNLKLMNTYRNKLSLSFNKGIFDISTDFGYSYFDKPIITSYSVENDKIISYSNNQKYQHYLSWDGNVNVKIIPNVWTVSGWFTLQRDIFESSQNKVTSYNSIYAGIRSNLMYKNADLTFGLNSRYKDLWGETISYNDDWNYVETGYKYKEAKLSLGMSYPFKNYWSVGNRNVSAVKPSKSWLYIKENGHMLYFRFSWNVSFGRKHEAGKKSLDNADTDKGIL